MLFDPSSSTQIYTLPVMFQKRSETMFIFWRLTRRSLCSLTRLPSKTDLGCSKTWRGVVCLVEPRALSGTAAISSGGCVAAGARCRQVWWNMRALVQQQQASDLLLFSLLRHSLLFFFSSTINIPFGLYTSAMTSLPRILRECVTSSATQFSQEIVSSQTKLHRATTGIQGAWEWEW